MGIVYKAHDRILEKTCALKVLPANLQRDKGIVATFIREAKATAKLNHINIVTVYDAGVESVAHTPTTRLKLFQSHQSLPLRCATLMRRT